MTELTRDKLRELLRYDPETGLFVRLVNSGRHPAGETCGWRSYNGYIYVSIDGKDILAHRLAWLYMTGEWPKAVDHINCTKSDNRFANLRLASKSQNARNYVKPRNNTSGIKGVSFAKRENRWRADICVDGRQQNLGYYMKKEDAASAYRMASRKLFGDFTHPAA